MAATENEKILIGPDEGAHLPIIEGRIPPGDMIPPHTHTREDECAFVFKGELTFDVGGQIVAAPAGSFVLKPRGVYHAFCNTGTEVAHVLEFHTPGGFENHYDEYERIVRSAMDEYERLKALTELGERYGVSWHDELIPEAMARFDIGP